VILLQDAPHSIRIVARMPPISAGIEIAEIDLVLHPVLDRGHGAGDLAGDEGFAADRALVVEQDAARACRKLRGNSP
jgi:hypothetical protein